MRIWEFEDKKEAPSDLVREQDFILRVRRMQRMGFPCLVLNIVLTAIEPVIKSQSLLEEAQAKLKAIAASTRGTYHEMSNGDVFLVWENPGEARLVAGRVLEAALADYKDKAAHFLFAYRMPENYALLRERTNAYVEEVRRRIEAESSREIDKSSGHLTAKVVDQIEHLLNEIDIRPYGHVQCIYRDDAKGGKTGNDAWTPVTEEYFVSFENLRRECFPKLEFERSEHLFLALCTLLDQKLLGALTTFYDIIAGRVVNLNLSIASIMGSLFAQFVRRVPHDQRNFIGFKLHCGDMLQDFSLTLSAIDVLKREGFRIVLDGITPDMAHYINLNKFAVDRIKINVSKDRANQMLDPAIRKGVEQLPLDKLVFFHCDNEHALQIGRELGVSHFQGWLIDKLADKKRMR